MPPAASAVSSCLVVKDRSLFQEVNVMKSRESRKSSRKEKSLKWVMLALLLLLLSIGTIALQQLGILRQARAQGTPATLGLLIIVNTTGDQDDAASPSSGVCDVDLGTAGDQCTLRAAIEVANQFPGSTIRISIPSSDPNCDVNDVCTINLASKLPDLSTDMSIVGPGADFLTVRRNSSDKFRIFTVTDATASFSGLTVREGATDNVLDFDGGGIWAHFVPPCSSPCTTVNVTDCTIIANSARLGGGLANEGNTALNITHSLIADNTAGLGGGISVSGSTTVTDSTIIGNQATAITGAGGGI